MVKFVFGISSKNGKPPVFNEFQVSSDFAEVSNPISKIFMTFERTVEPAYSYIVCNSSPVLQRSKSLNLCFFTVHNFSVLYYPSCIRLLK